MGKTRTFRADRLAKPALTLAVGAALLWALTSRLGHLDPMAIRDAVYDVTPLQWALALVSVTVSFLAVGGQERVLHRHLRTGVPGPRAYRAGMAAGAVSQTAGFGPLTGAFVRWRLLPGLTLWQATRISTALTLGFLASLAVFASLVLVSLRVSGYQTFGWAILSAATVIFALSALRPHWLPGRALWPNAVTMLAFLGWAALDLTTLSVALWALFPASHAPHFATLLPVVLLALGAGLASGAPAGVGAFEMVLIFLLPDVPEEPLLAAVIAWRAIFYALPAVIGALWTALAPRPAAPRGGAAPHAPNLAPRAETALLAQGELALLRTACQSCLTGRTPHVLAALFEPFPGPPDPATLASLASQARSENRVPALYKSDARTAAIARRAGFHPVRIAIEAVVTPATFDLSKPPLASLRRKLRKADAAGITIACGHDPHCPGLARINAEWSLAHKGERGFSMGRFCPDYLARQRLYVAWHEGRAIAFASFHTTAQEWTLDLMRYGVTAPDGTMQSLITAAISDAAARNVPRLSLAAIPALPPLLARFAPGQAAGLARFKQTFAPRWEPRYLSAPGRLALALAAAEIARAIRHPAPLQPPAAPSHAPAHEEDADYEFATAPVSWQRKA